MYCRNCGKPLHETIIEEKEGVERSAFDMWIRKMGREGLLALIGFGLMALSAFLPWAVAGSALGEIRMTGLQVAKGEPGAVLLVVAVLGGFATLFSEKLSCVICILGGFGILLEVKSVMDNVAKIAASVTSAYVWAGLDSGGYLALVSGFIVLAAGILHLLREMNKTQ